MNWPITAVYIAIVAFGLWFWTAVAEWLSRIF
jgi:hypothetical protein